MMGIDERPGIDGKEIIPVETWSKVISMAFLLKKMHRLFGEVQCLVRCLRISLQKYSGENLITYFDLPPGTGDVALDVHSMLPSSKEIIVTTPHPTAAFVAARAGAMAKHTEHTILGVIENMSYFESKETGKKSMFSERRRQKLSDELETQLFAELPLEQPTWNPNDFSPSIYQSDDRLGELYTLIARKVIASTQNNKIENI